MTTAADLGINMQGGVLQNIPPNASLETQVATLNNIINKLNTWNGVVVKQDTVGVIVGAAEMNIATYPHGLSYAPTIEAYLNGVSITGIASTTLNLPLPTWLQVDVIVFEVSFGAYMQMAVDETNVYFLTSNGTGIALGTFLVTYVLKRMSANNKTIA